MKKTRILSGVNFLFIPILSIFYEIVGILFCYFSDLENVLEFTLLALLSIILIISFIVANRIITVVAYVPEKGIVTRRGLFMGFYREISISDIIRTEVRRIPKDNEYILLLDEDENQCFDSLSPNMPIRIPNNAKGKAFVASFYNPHQ